MAQRLATIVEDDHDALVHCQQVLLAGSVIKSAMLTALPSRSAAATVAAADLIITIFDDDDNGDDDDDDDVIALMRWIFVMEQMVRSSRNQSCNVVLLKSLAILATHIKWESHRLLDLTLPQCFSQN